MTETQKEMFVRNIKIFDKIQDEKLRRIAIACWDGRHLSTIYDFLAPHALFNRIIYQLYFNDKEKYDKQKDIYRAIESGHVEYPKFNENIIKVLHEEFADVINMTNEEFKEYLFNCAYDAVMGISRKPKDEYDLFIEKREKLTNN